jgi:HlyD family secretion protein
MFTRLRNLTLVGLALIGVAGAIRVLATPQQAASAQTRSAVPDISRVDRGAVSLTVSATGSIQANQTVSLTFATTGKVTSINVAEGDHVRKGQTIAMLDSTAANDALLLAQSQVDAQQVALHQLTDKPRQVDINVAQAALGMAQAQLKEASSGGSRTQAQIDALKVEGAKNQLWQTELQRDADNQKKAGPGNTQGTSQQGNANVDASGYDVQIAQANADASKSKGASVGSMASAQASVTSAQVNLDNLLNGGNKDDIAKAQAQLESAQHALDAAKANLAKTILVAPFDGIVAQINLHSGETPPTSAAVIMLDTSRFSVDVAIDETDISKVAVGQPVTLTLDALPGVSVNGQVGSIAPTSTLNGNVVTYLVHITVDPAGQPLRSAMSTTANIITQQAENVLRVPNRFITQNRSTNKSYVNVQQADGTFAPIEVTLGIRNGSYTEIKSGLSEGEVIAAGQVTQSGGNFGGPGRGPVGIPGLGGGPR